MNFFHDLTPVLWSMALMAGELSDHLVPMENPAYLRQNSMNIVCNSARWHGFYSSNNVLPLASNPFLDFEDEYLMATK